MASRASIIVGTALREERGTALLMSLTLVMVMTLLGVALFEMSTIEANLAKRDVTDVQLFYCAEAEVAHIYSQYLPGMPNADALWTPGVHTFTTDPFTLSGVKYSLISSVAEVSSDGNGVRVTATCSVPDGRTRTVQRNGTQQLGNLFAVGSAGVNSDSGKQELSSDLTVAGNGVPQRLGGPLVGGADMIGGDVYVWGNVSLREAGAVAGTITVAPGKGVDASHSFSPPAPGTTGSGTLNPIPVLTNALGTGAIDQIKAAVTNPDGTARMTGTYQGSTVYNVGEIFNQLGVTSEGNNERNLARPKNCTYGTASTDVKCQVWQDLAAIGPKQTCVNSCPPGAQPPTDGANYFFMGMPRSPSSAPQQTSFNVIYAAVVGASGELRQLGFTTQYSTLGSSLDSLLGANPDGEGRVDRLLDFTVGIDPSTGQGQLRDQPPIFYVDGYWRVDASSAGFAYNGRATVVSTKSVLLSDNLLYLQSMSNVNTQVPGKETCANGSDRTACGMADMLGIVAKDDIWTADPTGTIREVSAIMVAGRDFNVLEYTTPGNCCTGVSNSITINGSVMGLRGVALARDWTDPRLGQEGAACNSALAPCQPVVFLAADTSCGVPGCWRFLKMDSAGRLVVDTSVPSFTDGCVTTNSSPLTPQTCPPKTRRVTHFQFVVNFDKRLATNPGLLPPGMPLGPAGSIYAHLDGDKNWKDCGCDSSCGLNPSCATNTVTASSPAK